MVPRSIERRAFLKGASATAVIASAPLVGPTRAATSRSRTTTSTWA